MNQKLDINRSEYTCLNPTNVAYDRESVKITIDEYRNLYRDLDNKPKDNRPDLYCIENHPVTAVFPETKKPHFRHLNCDHECKSYLMTDWHRNWQAQFENKEIYFRKIEGSYKCRKADAMVSDNVIEFQHYRFPNLNEVVERSSDYNRHGKNIIWIIDGINSVDIEYLEHAETYLIRFKPEFSWKYQQYLCCQYIFLDCVDGHVYKINPNEVKSHMIDVKNRTERQEFTRHLKNNEPWIDDDPLPQCTLHYNQSGAGNGKTYTSIQLLNSDPRFQHKTTFLYLTKQHSAKEVIYKELIDQFESDKLPNINDAIEDCGDSSSKHYKLMLDDRQIIIGTIDSFMYSLKVDVDATPSADYFKSIVESISNGHINKDRNGNIRWARRNINLSKSVSTPSTI